MAVYHCQCPGIDMEDDWFRIVSFEPQDAALEYATRCDDMSGGEVFSDPSVDVELVRVKDETGTINEYRIGFEFVKEFFFVAASRNG